MSVLVDGSVDPNITLRPGRSLKWPFSNRPIDLDHLFNFVDLISIVELDISGFVSFRGSRIFKN